MYQASAFIRFENTLTRYRMCGIFSVSRQYKGDAVMIDLDDLATENPKLSEDELREVAAEQELESFLIDEHKNFEENTIRTKEALLESIEVTRSRYQAEATSDQGKHSESFYAVLDDLLSEFRRELVVKNLPEPLNDWWAYSYAITSYGIKLMMNFYRWSHSYGSCFDCSRADEITVFEVPAKMLPVSEYAAMNGVEPVTVRQWIRRAKIRSAMKYGREWLIPELAEIPKGKGYSPCHYYWKSTLSDLPAKFAFLNEFKSAFIDQSEEDKDKFLLSLSIDRPGEYNRMIDAIAGTGSEIELDKIRDVLKTVPDIQITAGGKIILSGKDRAELELYMIANPIIHCQTFAHHKHQIDEVGTEYCGLFLSVDPT